MEQRWLWSSPVVTRCLSTQTRISEIYFSRYIETIKKLQAIVMNIPIETA